MDEVKQLPAYEEVGKQRKVEVRVNLDQKNPVSYHEQGELV